MAGPVRALAIVAGAQVGALSGRFRRPRPIRSSLERSTTKQVLQFHDGAVRRVQQILRNNVVGRRRRRGASRSGRGAGRGPALVLEGGAPRRSSRSRSRRTGGRMLASASWDPRPRASGRSTSGPARVLEGHAAERQRRRVRARRPCHWSSRPATTRRCASGRAPAPPHRWSSRCRRRSTRWRSRPTARS